MIRRDKVIRGLECMKSIKRPTEEDCASCGYKESFDCGRDVSNDALALLKEDCHNCKLECLLSKYDDLKEKYDALLKENASTLGIHIHNDRITFTATGDAKQGEERGILLGKTIMYEGIEKELLKAGLLTDEIRIVLNRINSNHFGKGASHEQ